MKKLMIVASLVSLILAVSNNAFAHWKCPIGTEIQDPAPVHSEVNLM